MWWKRTRVDDGTGHEGSMRRGTELGRGLDTSKTHHEDADDGLNSRTMNAMERAKLQGALMQEMFSIEAGE